MKAKYRTVIDQFNFNDLMPVNSKPTVLDYRDPKTYGRWLAGALDRCFKTIEPAKDEREVIS